jgi:hypothetical protein
MGHSSLGHHDLNKFLVVDLAITIDISLTDHLVNFLVGQLLPKLSSRDETVLVLVKDTEGLLQFLLGISVHLPCHEVQELREINGPVAISINLVDHVLHLCLRRVLAKGPHHSSKLHCSDATCKGKGRSKIYHENNIRNTQLIQ